ncbi:MAG: hypothetical protein ACYDD2_11010 [Candidatus Acidiferrales bacterium]
MKKVLWFGLLMLFLVPVSVMAQSAFNGTWKIDTNKARFSKKPDVYLLQNGMWHCKSCVPPINMKADGGDYKLASSSPCSETASMKVIDGRTVLLTGKGKGRITYTDKGTVSQDGKTLTWEGTDTCKGESEPETSESEETRIANGPAGAHAISGSWRTVKASASENSLLMTMAVEGDTLSYSDPTGVSFAAKFGGPSVLMKGDPNHTMVAVRLVGKNTIVNTYRLNGKVVGYDRSTVAPDGKTMTIMSTDLSHARTNSVVAEKQ